MLKKMPPLRWIIEIVRRQKPRLTIWATASLIFLPVLLIAWLHYQQTSHYLTEMTFSRRESVSHLTAIALTERFDRLTELGVSIATRPRFKGLVENKKWDEAMTAIQQVVENSSYVTRMLLCDPTGRVGADFPVVPGIKGTDFSHRDWYLGVKKDWKPYVSEVFKRAAIPQINVFVASIPIKANNGTVVGILVLQVPISTLLDWSSNTDFGSSSFTYFVDQYQHVTLPSPISPVEIKNINETSLAQATLEKPAGIEITSDPFTNTQIVLSYEWIPKYKWVVVTQQSSQEAFAVRDKTLNNLLILYGLLGIFGVAFIFAFEKIQTSKTNLLKSEDRLQYALENAHLGYWDLELATGVVRRSSKHDGIFGYPENQKNWTSETFFKHVHPEDMEKVKETFEESLHHCKESHFECRILWNDGSTHWIWHRSIVEVDGQGRPIRITGMVGDITERKKLELELIQARDEALQGVRAKSSFLAVMSHEIRTPMNGILGFTQLLKKTSLSSEQNEFIGIIDQCGKGLLTLINDILDYSKIESEGLKLESKSIPLEQIFDGISEMFSLDAKHKNLELTFDLDPTLPSSFLGDPVRIRQVLINLVGNSIKFTSVGSITIRLWKIPHPTKPLLEFSVIDTGIGIPVDRQHQLFMPFSQIDGSSTRSHGGTGLGLSICRSLIEKMNGKIHVQSAPGKGSSFIFQIPLETTSPLTLTPSQIIPLRDVSGDHETSLRILAVEDNPINQYLNKVLLEEMGYKPDLVGSAFLALEKLQSQTYDLFLIDIQMPGMDGIELCRRIRIDPKNKNAIIIAVSAGVLEEERKKALDAGMDEFIMKPIDITVFRSAMKRINTRVDHNPV